MVVTVIGLGYIGLPTATLISLDAKIVAVGRPI
jgi:UDP-N-acetyl-D-mannosaminuronate dehydrogenase